VGHPLTRAAFIQALAHSPMRRRYLLSVLLSIRTGGASRISTSAFSETQRAQLASLGSWKGREEPWTHEFSLFCSPCRCYTALPLQPSQPGSGWGRVAKA